MKKAEKQAKKNRNVDEYKECQMIRAQYEQKKSEEQLKAIVRTVAEQNRGKDPDQVIDLHGLKGREALTVIQHQLDIIENKLIEGEIEPNTEGGHVYCIVTGKGIHGKRSVLKTMAERYLLKEGFTYTELKNKAGFKVLFE